VLEATGGNIVVSRLRKEVQPSPKGYEETHPSRPPAGWQPDGGRDMADTELTKEQERLAAEYGKLQERYTLLGGYGLEAEAKRILQGLGFRESDFQRATDELSGGWLMRIALSKILLQSPDLLLLDEPSLGLAPLMVNEIYDIIRRFNTESKTSVLLVEQNLPMALRVADYLYILSNGEVVYESTPDHLRSNDEVKARYIGVSG
jgi:ABC-type multidrug transport system ATPase subunit